MHDNSYQDLMTRSLTELLEPGETLQHPIYGALLEKKRLHRFGYFGLTDRFLLVALLLPGAKQIAWTSRVPLDLASVRVRRCLFPGQRILYLSFHEGNPGRIRVSSHVVGIPRQKENLDGFLVALTEIAERSC